MLVDENASLVEEPHVVTGSFDRAFLALPAAVIRAVARGHQKYFCIQRSEDELLPSYLAVVNTANRPDLIAKGTDRVMRARLSDARFFWQEDQKTPLDARLDKLGGIVFHNRLGTVREKVDRIERLAERIAETLGLDRRSAERAIGRAARLCKCDLVTLMVGEFPELQGHMGRAYALAQGEPARDRRRDPRPLQAARRAGRRRAGRRVGGHRARRSPRHARRLLRRRPRADGRGRSLRACGARASARCARSSIAGTASSPSPR